MICIKCGRCNSSLYTVYNKTNIKLNECNRCRNICDEYMEKNTFLIFINILFLKPEVYRHIIFNRLKYHDKFIHIFFLKMIILFLIINAYLHPNFENDHKEGESFSNFFLKNTTFGENTQRNYPNQDNCSSYTLFMYKYDDKHKLYGLYNIFNQSNVPNLVNIHKNKFLTCIFHNRFRDYNMCILNRKYEHMEDYDKRLIDLFLHNKESYGRKEAQASSWKGKLTEGVRPPAGKSTSESPNWTELYPFIDGKKWLLKLIQGSVKYESIFKLRKNHRLLRNDIVTLNNSEENSSLFQIINLLVYYHVDDYKLVLETREKEAYNIDYLVNFLHRIFFYQNGHETKNYFKSEMKSFVRKASTKSICPDPRKEIFPPNKCYDCELHDDPYNNLDKSGDELNRLCRNIFKNIDFTFHKNVEEIRKKENQKKHKFKIKQISMYSKLLFSDLDNEKYILKICNSSFSFKKLKSIIINYMLYFFFLCIFTYILKLYQEKKYRVKITMVKYNYLFMLFVLSNYPIVIYFILKVFNYNYINIYLNVYTIICNTIAYHIFISNDENYICYSIFSVLASYLLKNFLMIKIGNYL
ncbi:conserved Plasmodium protein, unknown function [Plasmodium knowlesi strain H]|uniref:Protein ARV n=3 Tax=Plasmodium knowlesi TaxID=5850 RepID=A0A5K1UE83_PLAKH|nr:protein ARV1, putative [Plasmodium knowlesi strain H]OTN65840.1 Uncharacterized protein PKNOH_S100039100 [Plasmodium knowlesi]CAA9987754.1 protein ARV1, putative [Plasmodium knowlesi strain H]SBO27078.1 conserved Plasmodium protein, unknown function [Plasmodium knowlesi strain H]SBO29443.1 conserved Plasmodium protein, unknown function [Plasmodium knowlesi strain H]VVS77228.1 protein ARV1, putative [Plasmodium knowlesi strain H]|eukprot:XP_002258751.1 hypothetical protein, conserved in Plasmodium species [Plasmodium knowlesi strain H]